MGKQRNVVLRAYWDGGRFVSRQGNPYRAPEEPGRERGVSLDVEMRIGQPESPQAPLVPNTKPRSRLGAAQVEPLENQIRSIHRCRQLVDLVDVVDRADLHPVQRTRAVRDPLDSHRLGAGRPRRRRRGARARSTAVRSG